jgi:hypothetical protein
MLLFAEPKNFQNMQEKKKKKMIFVEFRNLTNKLSTWLIAKFGVALDICNRISLGVGY